MLPAAMACGKKESSKNNENGAPQQQFKTNAEDYMDVQNTRRCKSKEEAVKAGIFETPFKTLAEMEECSTCLQKLKKTDESYRCSVAWSAGAPMTIQSCGCFTE
jgi:hypothetical protein